MLKTRFLALVAALTVGFAPALASAAAVKAPVVYDAAGRPIQTTPVINVDTTGTYVAPGGGGVGGAATIASGADVVEGSTADTSTSNTIYGVMLALKAAAQDTSTESPMKIADGSDVALGITTVSACSTDNGNCAVTALLKRLNQNLTTLNTSLATLHTDMGLAIPAGTALIGATNLMDTGGITKATVKAASTPPVPGDTGLAVTRIPDTHAQCSALCANLVVKSSAGVLKDFEVSADSTLSGAIWYVIIYDATAAPADGAITPVKCYQQPAGVTQMGGTLADAGLAMTVGDVIGVSTTGCFTKTASTHAFIAADFQ